MLHEKKLLSLCVRGIYQVKVNEQANPLMRGLVGCLHFSHTISFKLHISVCTVAAE